MKIEDLVETPYHSGNGRKQFTPTHFSATGIAREYSFIGSVQLMANTVSFFSPNLKPERIIGCIRADRPNVEGPSTPGWLAIVDLEFKTYHTFSNIPEGVDESKIRQVEYIEVADGYDIGGLASSLYMMLAKSGDVIVSDTVQFTGGQQLWKKLAKQAGFNDLQVLVVHDKEGFKKDENGDIIQYTGVNIPDGELWTYMNNVSGQHTLFMLINSK